MRAPWSGSDCYHEQLKRNSKFLCLDQRMHTELVGRIVLQLNRTYPQILTDKEALRFRNLSAPTAVRLAELLVYLQGKGEEEFHEFYRGLQIHADKVYFNLLTRVSRRRGPLFFLSCFSLAVGLALLYCYGECNLSGTGPFLSFSVLGLGSGASEVLLANAKAYWI
ncbi:caspase recruitment domain-containing protein 19-like [Salmo salar]|uniref:Caspase recruitment domain-containing protein 19-like n=1 Tax=Salmo salar TaxID=8030 RepID=A0ABM3CZQ7_SALSA|nr:caspase recruitment domain-containing protein 19-like [Salmo salar]